MIWQRIITYLLLYWKNIQKWYGRMLYLLRACWSLWHIKSSYLCYMLAKNYWFFLNIWLSFELKQSKHWLRLQYWQGSVQKLVLLRFKLLWLQIIHKEHRYNYGCWHTGNHLNFDILILLKYHKNQWWHCLNRNLRKSFIMTQR